MKDIVKQLQITNELLFWIALRMQVIPKTEEIRIRRQIPDLRKKECAICTDNYSEAGIEPNCGSCPYRC